METTLDLVLRVTGGAALVPLKKTALFLGLEPQTIRNRLRLGTWPLPKIKQGGRVYFGAPAVASYAASVGLVGLTAEAPPVAGPRRGTSTAAERQAARAAGFASVAEWRQAYQ